ncbi:hypothetical protein HPB50_015658 [Hyalomma asiaticum]|uniref:Uncharacterized protein n=1 Tax=Hyalomma asiaticum TaxID=266040 RepID=A0ACB7TIT0_HYAAI|nr:hypothetical protein HPB50_015658 [Hyalomma asiaticum]
MSDDTGYPISNENCSVFLNVRSHYTAAFVHNRIDLPVQGALFHPAGPERLLDRLVAIVVLSAPKQLKRRESHYIPTAAAASGFSLRVGMAALVARSAGKDGRQEGGGSRLGVAVMRARTRHTCRVTSVEDKARSGRQCRACRPHCLRCRAFDLGPVALRICCAARGRVLRPIDAQRAAAATARHCIYYTARPEPPF